MGSFKLSYDDIKKKLLQFDEEVITQNALENFIKFLPNKEQVIKLIYKHHWADFNRTIFNFALLRPYFIESSFIVNCRFYNLTGDMTEMSPQHLFTGFSKHKPQIFWDYPSLHHISFVPNAPFLYPLKTPENRKIF